MSDAPYALRGPTQGLSPKSALYRAAPPMAVPWLLGFHQLVISRHTLSRTLQWMSVAVVSTTATLHLLCSPSGARTRAPAQELKCHAPRGASGQRAAATIEQADDVASAAAQAHVRQREFERRVETTSAPGPFVLEWPTLPVDTVEDDRPRFALLGALAGLFIVAGAGVFATRDPADEG